MRRLLARLPWATRRHGRVRSTSMDPIRLSLASLALLALTTAVTLALIAWQLHHTVQRSSKAVVALIESRLVDIERQGHRIVDSPEGIEAGLRGVRLVSCTPSLVTRLVQESLDSSDVRRWMLQDIDDSSACGPLGVMAPLKLPDLLPWRSALLASQRAGSSQPVVVRRIDSQNVLVAQLDEQAMSLPTSGRWTEALTKGSDVSLVTTDGRVLTLGARSSTRALSLDQESVVLESVESSPQHGFSVRTALCAEALLSNGLAAWPWILFTWLALTSFLIAWSWRRLVLRARLVHRIERALTRREFAPFIQPIMDLQTGACIGGEVLMRWNHPERGIVGPGEFIVEAERTGLIVGMSDLVMTRAAFQLSSIAQQHPDFYFSFNVTPLQLRHPQFAQTLSDLFRHDSVPRSQVLLELTERDIVDPLARSALVSLHASGWRFAIDDFGTGHSSLATIERLPIDRLKIDRSFVSTIGGQTVSRPVLDAIITLGRDLGISLVAEGVEQEVQWQYLRERGVAAAQGFLMAKPMPIESFAQWLQTHQANRVRPVAANASTALQPSGKSSAPARDDALESLCTRMLSDGGVDVRDRMYHLRSYRQCFIASEAVRWLAVNQRVSLSEAIRIGRRMVALGLIRHVHSEHDFSDGELFFVATPVQAFQLATLPPLGPLGDAMRSSTKGLPLTHVRRGLWLHRNTITGKGVVTWLTKHHDISRETATQWAAALMKQGTLRHVYDDRAFTDTRELYRLK